VDLDEFLFIIENFKLPSRSIWFCIRISRCSGINKQLAEKNKDSALSLPHLTIVIAFSNFRKSLQS